MKVNVHGLLDMVHAMSERIRMLEAQLGLEGDIPTPGLYTIIDDDEPQEFTVVNPMPTETKPEGLDCDPETGCC